VLTHWANFCRTCGAPEIQIELIRHGAVGLADERRRRLLPLLCGLAGRIFRGVEADFPGCGDCVVVRLRFVFDLCREGSQWVSFSGFCEFGYSRGRTSVLQHIWLHDDDYGRNADGTDRSDAVRQLFLLEARDFRNGILRFLVFREFSVHRDVHGGCSGAGVAAGWFWGSRLGDFVWAVGMVEVRREDRRGDASDRVGGNDRGAWVVGLANLSERSSRARGAGGTDCWVSGRIPKRDMVSLPF
jgi:hypothetical protein